MGCYIIDVFKDNEMVHSVADKWKDDGEAGTMAAYYLGLHRADSVKLYRERTPAGRPTCHLAGVASAVGIAWALGARREMLLSLAPKSVGIALGVSGEIGEPTVVRLAGVADARAIGLGIGVGSHGIGAARVLQLSKVSGAFSGLAMSTSPWAGVQQSTEAAIYRPSGQAREALASVGRGVSGSLA